MSLFSRKYEIEFSELEGMKFGTSTISAFYCFDLDIKNISLYSNDKNLLQPLNDHDLSVDFSEVFIFTPLTKVLRSTGHVSHSKVFETKFDRNDAPDFPKISFGSASESISYENSQFRVELSSENSSALDLITYTNPENFYLYMFLLNEVMLENARIVDGNFEHFFFEDLKFSLDCISNLNIEMDDSGVFKNFKLNSDTIEMSGIFDNIDIIKWYDLSNSQKIKQIKMLINIKSIVKDALEKRLNRY